MWSSCWRCCLGHSKNFSDDDDDDDVCTLSVYLKFLSPSARPIPLPVFKPIAIQPVFAPLRGTNVPDNFLSADYLFRRLRLFRVRDFVRVILII